MTKYVVIDDDKTVRSVIMRIIDQHMLGEVVAECENGLQGEEAILKFKPDIVIIDLLLPQQDGISIVKKVKSLNCRSMFIMLSQVSSKDMIARAYECGIEFFINKPINIIEVQNVIKKVKEYLTLKNTFETIESTVSVLKGNNTSNVIVSTDNNKKIINHILADLGILGDLGSKDISNICMMLFNDKNLYETMEEMALHDLLKLLQNKYKSENHNFTSDVKAIEMRIRRTVSKAMKNIASMGIEDFANEKFNLYSTSLFDYADIKIEMDYIRGKVKYSGKVNVKSFIRRLMVMIERFA